MNAFEHPKTTTSWDDLYYKERGAIRFYDDVIRKTLKLLGASAGDKVLDAGCGAGVHSIRAARNGCRVDALDFSEAALADAKVRAREAGMQDKISFFQEDLTKLTFSDCSYAKIFSWGVLIHIPEIEKAMDELARVLAVGGKLALYIVNESALQFFQSRLRILLSPGSSKWKRLPYGVGSEIEFNDRKLWVWRNDIRAIQSHMEKRGLRLISKHAGEFTDWHLHFPGVGGRMLWSLNNIWLRLGLPARFAQMNLLIFEKPDVI